MPAAVTRQVVDMLGAGGGSGRHGAAGAGGRLPRGRQDRHGEESRPPAVIQVTSTWPCLPGMAPASDPRFVMVVMVDDPAQR